MKRLLLIDNSIGDRYHAVERLPASGFPMPCDRINLYAGDPVPRLEGYTHLIATGCTKSICTPEPWMDGLKALLQAALERNLNILAICFSHQMLAQAAAGERYARRRAAPELGWVKQTVLRDDPLFGRKGTEHWGFVSHFDEVSPDLPEEKGQILLRSDFCEVEAFRVTGRNAWGVQGHFEEDIESGRRMLQWQIEENPALAEYVQNGQAPKDSGLWAELLDRFCRLEYSGGAQE